MAHCKILSEICVGLHQFVMGVVVAVVCSANAKQVQEIFTIKHFSVFFSLLSMM